MTLIAGALKNWSVIGAGWKVVGQEEILSDLEWKVLMSYLDGKSYQEIAAGLHRHVKSIDNALQRVKRKLEKYMENRGEGIDLATVYQGLSAINRRRREEDAGEDTLLHE